MKNMKKKSFLILATMVLLLTFAVGGTIAYLVTSTNPVVNTFTPGKVTCAVVEGAFTDGTSATKTDVKIQNTGNTTAWIRAMVVANWCDASGNIVAPETVNLTMPANGWSKGQDGYYYYGSIVAAGGKTQNLIGSYTPTRPTTVPAGSHLEMTIICQAVQSNLGDSATEAFVAAAKLPTT